jgi:transposase
MGNPAGVRRDFQALEQRRMQAARLLERYSRSEVARRVGVHRQSVSGRTRYRRTGARGSVRFSGARIRFFPDPQARPQGPVKLKGELLEFALAQKKENPTIDLGHLAALLQEHYGIAIHRTTVLGGLKDFTRRGKSRRGAFVAGDDPVQGNYESVRCEAVEHSAPASWALERIRR